MHKNGATLPVSQLEQGDVLVGKEKEKQSIIVSIKIKGMKKGGDAVKISTSAIHVLIECFGQIPNPTSRTVE